MRPDGSRVVNPRLILVDMALTQADLICAQQLCTECEHFERAELWYAASADCGLCGGFPFRTSDIQAQLGACGCLVAISMEMEAAYNYVPDASTKQIDSFVEEGGKPALDVRMLQKMLNLQNARSASTSELYYLQSTSRGRGRDRLKNGTHMMKVMRYRERKDKKNIKRL